MKISELIVDVEAETSGRWASWHGDVELLIARMHTPAFQEAIRLRAKDDVDKIRDGDSDLLREFTIEVVAELVLLGWKNLEDANGVPIPYSKEMAIELLSNPGLRDLYSFVLTTASGREHFLVQDSVKN